MALSSSAIPRNNSKMSLNLSRDVEHTNNAITPIFDKEKEQNHLREINLIGEIGNQAADIARTQGKIAEEKALKGKEAQEAAGKLGFDSRILPNKAPFNSHGQTSYFNGKTYITPDIDSHNVTNGWKMFDRRGQRIGTYDSDLNKIKD